MRLTGKQAHVLDNLERVERRPYKVATSYSRPRFDLDGWECTYQVTALVVRKKVRHLPGGSLVRLPAQPGAV